MIQKIYEPSALRRGRLSTVPTFYVHAPDGSRWRFQRKRDAQAFVDRGLVCPDHEDFLCRSCHGSVITPPA